MELRWITAFAAVADEGSFGRAAQRLGYTQSTISQQIAALEKAVGGAVFDRPGGPKPVRLTPLGAVVLGHGRGLLAGAAELATAVERFRAGEGRIDIGTFQSVSNVLLPQVVQRLREEYPTCEIRLFEEETDEPRLDGLDLMFFDGRAEGDLTHHKLLDDPYVVVARPGVFPPGPVRPDDLDDVPIVAYPLECDQPRVERELADAGVRPRFVFRTAGNEAILSMVRAGIGSALLPRLAVHSANELVVHPLHPALRPREIYLLWQAGRTHSPLAARAIEIATEISGGMSGRDHRRRVRAESV